MSGPRTPAADRPVAEVAVDVPLAHLDRPFDYLVPEALADAAAPGTRVRVRLAGRLTGGFVLARKEGSGHAGRLAFLERVVSAEPVLTPPIARLCREVANRCAGTFADVVRLAVPPRHARVEAQPRPAGRPAASGAPAAPPGTRPPAGWSRYPGGPGLLAELAGGAAPRVVWAQLPGPHWLDELAAAVSATVGGGRGVVAVLPDADRARRLAAALPAGEVVLLTAEDGPAARYRAFLTALRGDVPAVVGTRSAAFAPVHRLGLALLYDDGSDAHREPHAPSPHMRDVLLTRARLENAGLLLAGPAVSVEGAALVGSGWARGLRAVREEVRRVAPRVSVAGSDAELARDPAARAARLPSLAWRTARRALETGPVLVQVPRRGYQAGLACARCRAPSRCPACHGPLRRPAAGRVPACSWCGRPAVDLACPECGGRELRAALLGSARTAEELGRSFPGVPVLLAGASRPPPAVPAGPALVVATPGAEPPAPGEGYPAVLLLDGWLLLGRPDLRAAEEAFRRWAGALALARPGGAAVVIADPGAPAVQALVRWDPAGFADREAAERAALRFPPATRLASVAGEPAAAADLLAHLELPPGGERLGPVPAAPGEERWLLRVPREHGGALAAAVKAALAVRSARKAGGGVRVQLDPDLTF